MILYRFDCAKLFAVVAVQLPLQECFPLGLGLLEATLNTKHLHSDRFVVITLCAQTAFAEVMVLDGKAHLLRGARPIAEMINDESIPDFTAAAKS